MQRSIYSSTIHHTTSGDAFCIREAEAEDAEDLLLYAQNYFSETHAYLAWRVRDEHGSRARFHQEASERQ